LGIETKKLSMEVLVRANLKTAIAVRFGSQLAFARAAGLHSVKVNRLCRGWIEPTPLEREQISEALRADADWLFAEVRIPAPRNLSIETAAPALASVNVAVSVDQFSKLDWIDKGPQASSRN
jgi:hypothetical protein